MGGDGPLGSNAVVAGDGGADGSDGGDLLGTRDADGPSDHNPLRAVAHVASPPAAQPPATRTTEYAQFRATTHPMTH